MFKFPDGLHYGKFSSSNKDKDGHHHPADVRSRRLVIAALLVSVALGSDFFWSMGEETLSLLLELIEQGVERFFTKTIGLDTFRAQMASAYTYFVVSALLGFWLIRRLLVMLRHARTTGYLWWCAFSASTHQVWRERMESFLGWWQLQDWLNKTAVVVGFVVTAIPMMVVLSLVLGSAIAELL